MTVAFVATLPLGSVLADALKDKTPKVTLVCQPELPNVPGWSIKGALVEWPGVYSPGRTRIPNPPYATVLADILRRAKMRK
jgi:hypothetical protein